MRSVLILLAAGVLLAGCDQLSTPILASSAPGGNGASTRLAITPAQAQLVVGATLQLTTNASAALQPQVQWQSFQPAIAAVNASGVVTAIAAGTAVVEARFAFDTTQAATTAITVIGPTTPTASDTGATGSTGG